MTALMNPPTTVRVVSDGTGVGTHIEVDGKPLEAAALITKVTCSIEAGGLSQVTLHTDYVDTDITVTNNQPVIDKVRALHKPTTGSSHGSWCARCLIPAGNPWPCATARLVYTEAEIAAAQP